MMIRMQMPLASYIFQAICRKISHFLKTIHTSCRDHLTEAGENYFKHLWFTCKMSAQFIAISIVLLIHGLVPYLFTRTASGWTEKIYRTMKSRRPNNLTSEDRHYDI